MSFRDRIAKPQPNERAIDEFELRRAYRNVFASADGQKVLDHIVQSICGVDAVVQYSNDVQAYIALERKNVGLMIARYALGPKDETKVGVKT